MKLPRFKKSTIAKKMMVPMTIVLIIQAGLFWGTVLFGGTIRQLNRNAFDILNERAVSRKIDLQNQMVQQWSNLDATVQQINAVVNDVLSRYEVTAQSLLPGEPVTNEVLADIAPDMVYMLRRRGVTGAFVVFNGDGGTDWEAPRAGLCLRDYDPLTAPEDNSDLLAARAPAEISRSLGITLDTYWQPHFTFSSGAASDFYFKPFLTALEHPGLSYPDLGYWARPYSLSPQENKSIGYSVPLLGKDGKPYGVLGISVTTDYLRRLLPYDELASNKEAAYLLALQSGDESTVEVLFSTGPAYQTLFGGATVLQLVDEPISGDAYLMAAPFARQQETVFGSVNYLKLYNSNTPFARERWALVGLIDEQHLMAFSHRVERGILLALAVSLALGVASLVIVSRLFTKPIADLVEQMEHSDPSKPVRLRETNIYEIDEMADAIERLGHNVAESASKLSQIIELSSISIGAFEYDRATGRVLHIGHFFSILGLPEEEARAMSAQQFRDKMAPLEAMRDIDSPPESNLHIYRIERSPGNVGWARLKLVSDNTRVFGVAEDITLEILEKRKIEHERDYDLLTNLLNRRAFHSTMDVLFRRPSELHTAALIMLDLDNLKYINDTYGHDYGDQYICRLAQILRKSAPSCAVLSRMSGDEFYVFLYGYDDKNSVREQIEAIRLGIVNSRFALPGDPNFRVRASAGVAWYPDDTTHVDELIRYADFAMYTVKNTVKGEFSEFNIQNYKRDAYLLQGKEALNKLIDEELLDYHLQPIVDARTGAVFAYEALMRSRVESLKSPMEVLTLARTQSKLHLIERLTLFCSMRKFISHPEIPESCHIFINSIANQALADQDVAEFEAAFGPYLHRIVVELTEEEKLNDEFMARKQDIIRNWRGGLALDDFGTGYNGEASLLTLKPDYVKIDISIVRQINEDPNRLKLLQNLLSYTRERGIRVIAEGVETHGEMMTLIENGVDYLQGYYLGRPSPIPETPTAHIVEEIIRASHEMTF